MVYNQDTLKSMVGQPVLVISPHGLDEVLGCGGTITRHAEAGDRVDVLVLFGDGGGMDVQRRIAAPQAAAILGATAPYFVGLPENLGDTLPLVDVVGAVERAVRDLAPRVVYVTHGGNLHIDHQTAFRATLTALRPVPGSPIRAIYGYEILSSTEWAPRGVGEGFRPNRFVDITAGLERKMQALECYAAEMRAPPHSRSMESVRVLAAHRGATVGVAAAEAFDVVREIA